MPKNILNKKLTKILYTKLYIIFSFFIILSTTNTSFAQNASSQNYTKAASFCPYTFTHDLQLNTNDSDVKKLQQILNTDSRTMVAASGVGSVGQESNIYGKSTGEAVKRFQALFIEYTGIANGRFGPKTRTVMNAICNNVDSSTNTTSYNTVSTVSTPTNNNSQNSPIISLRSNLTSVPEKSNFRVEINSSESLARFDESAFIIEGATMSDFRQLSPTKYSALVTPNEGAKMVIIQAEAGKLVTINGSRNENASNEIRFGIGDGNDPNATKTNPGISLSANATTVANGDSIKITLTSDKPIPTLGNEAIYVDGGSVSKVQKSSPNTYIITVTPDGKKAKMSIQVEAEKILDNTGGKNMTASNELIITVSGTVSTTASSSSDFASSFASILAQINPAPAAATTCSNGATNPPTCDSFVNNNNNGYNSGSGNNGGNSSSGSSDSMMKMLLMSQMMGGNKNSGGLFGNNNSQPQGQQNQSNQNQNQTPPQTNPSPEVKQAQADAYQGCIVAGGDAISCGKKYPQGTTNPPKPDANQSGDLPKGGDVITKYTCAATAPATTGPSKDVKNNVPGSIMYFLDVKSDPDKKSIVIQYGKNLDDKQEDKDKKVDAKKSFVSGSAEIAKKDEKMMCCETVDINTIPGKYTCKPFAGLGEKVAGFYFKKTMEFTKTLEDKKSGETPPQSGEKTTDPTEQKKVQDRTDECQKIADNFLDFDADTFSTAEGNLRKIVNKNPQCKGYLVTAFPSTGLTSSCGEDLLTKTCIGLANDAYYKLSGFGQTTKNAVAAVVRNRPECADKITYGYTTSDVVCK